MNANILKVDPRDDVVVALEDLMPGAVVSNNGSKVSVREAVPAKHKIALRALPRGTRIQMYGTTVAEAVRDIAPGDRITTANVVHAAETVSGQTESQSWTPPDVSRWQDTSFMGYVRPNGQVGTGNYWMLAPLVFCENRNLLTLRDALLETLGYVPPRSYQSHARELVDMYRNGRSPDQMLVADLGPASDLSSVQRVFPNIDGLKFLNHELGCGGMFQDSETLCGLLAGYVTHPNVAGATILSLGCQKAQVSLLEQEIHRRDPHFKKPLHIVEQQQLGTEQMLMSEALKRTFVGLIEANRCRREPVPLSELCVGLECGGSDGFSGISANPAIGHASDLIVAMGGSVILSEFPELAGAEQNLINRAVDQQTARRFVELMEAYDARAKALGSGFDHNPSPGNVADGLTTDAIKSLGAAKKGGTSPVVDVLDYPEPATRKGLTLLCTPGGDVESVTAMVGSGANAVLFSTGLGTPTGNPIAPVIKISSNTAVAQRMPDVIDVDAGGIVGGHSSIESVGEQILERLIEAASGRYTTRSQALGQDDFIPWKRGISI